ncbi:MAG: restriction endonuclease [Candidatus Limnocylindrales bacterium]
MADEIPQFDLYAELEVSERASAETIQAAYRSLQLRNHPDRVGPGGGDRAVRLNIARDWLTDPGRRTRYDEHRADLRQRSETADATAAEEALAADEPRGADDADDEADDEAEAPDLDEGGLEDLADGTLRASHILLRLDLARFARVWIVGLAFLGGLALSAGLVSAAALRVVAAVGALLVLLALTTRRMRTSPDAGLVTRAKRTGWSMLGWLGLAVLAVDGASAVALALERPASGPGAALGVGGAVGPVLGATAAISLTALRRRAGPVRASVDDFLALTPTEFEVAVGQVLGRHGYRLRPTGGPGDLVADLTGTGPGGRSTVVQCKRYAPGHPVGSRDVQLLMALGLRHHRAEHLVLVTTSDFTDPARDLAEEHGIELINGEDLEELTR